MAKPPDLESAVKIEVSESFMRWLIRQCVVPLVLFIGLGGGLRLYFAHEPESAEQPQRVDFPTQP